MSVRFPGALARVVLGFFIITGLGFHAAAQTCSPPGGAPAITAPDDVCLHGSGPASVTPPAPGQSWESVTWTVTGGNFGWGPGGPMTTAGGSDVTFYADGFGQPVILQAHVRDFQGCEADATRTVSMRTIEPPAITVPEEICPHGNGVASVAPPAEGGSWDYVSWTITGGHFGWSIGGPLTTASGNEVTFYGDGSGQPLVLRAHVYDSQMCESEATATVDIRTIEPPVITVPAQICPHGNAVASVAPPAEGGTWEYVSWSIAHGSFGWGISGPLTNASGTAVTFYGDGSGDPVVLQVYAYDGQMCETQSTATVQMRTIDPPVITAPAQICPHGNAVASVAPPAEGGSWEYVSWTVSNGSFGWGMSGPLMNANGTSVTFYGDGSGQPVVLHAYAYDGQMCETQSTATVQMRAIDPPVITAPAAICAHGSGAASAAPPAEGGAWQWVSWTITNGSFGWGAYGPVMDATGTDVTFYGDGSGQPIVLQVYAYDNQMCEAQSTATVTIRTIPAPAITAPSAVCVGGNGTASIAPPADGGAWQYVSWGITNGSFGSGPYGPVTYASGPSVTFYADGSGNPVVLSTWSYDAGMCESQSSVTVPIATVPVPTITASNPAICPGGSVTLTSSAAASYLWSTGATTQSIGVTAPGTYSVTVTNAQGCSATSDPIALGTPAPESVTASGPTTFCDGGNVTLTASPAASYLWSNGATTQSTTVTTTGSYFVTATVSGCSIASTPVSVTVNPLPAATITPSGPTTFCAGGSVTLTASAGTSWLWSTGATTQSISVNASGSYSVTVTNASGCSATSAPTAVMVNALPVATITPSGPTTFCEGGSVTLTASAGTSWLWSNGATTQSITVSASASFNVTVTNAGGCSATSATTSTVRILAPNPTIYYTGTNPVCAGATTRLYTEQSTGNTYLWSNGATTFNTDVTEGGTYTVTVTNSAGCSRTSAPFVLTSRPRPTATVSGTTAICAGGSASISAALTGNGPWNLTWSDGFVQNGVAASPATRIVSPSSNATYSVTAVSDAYCVGNVSGSATVTVNANPVVAVTGITIFDSAATVVSQAGGVVEVCGTGTIRLVPSIIQGASYHWSTGANTAVLDVTGSGTYSVTVTTAAGCATTTSAVVNYTAYPAKPTVGATATELCPAGGSVTLTASAADGWLWSNGATTQSIVVTEPGTYTVRARTNLCQSQPSDPMVITTGTSAISASGTTSLCANASVTLTATGGTSWLWSNGATTQSIVVSDPGTFSVTTTNNGCTMPQSSPVTVTRRAVTINAGGPTTFCAPGSVTLTADAGTSWLWSTGATTQSIVASTSGSYSVTATFADGCTVQSAPVAVEARQLAVSVAADRNTVCPGGAISITSSVSGGTPSAYQWYQGGSYTPIAGATSPSYTFSPTVNGFVYLKVTDALGCEATSNAIQYTIQPAIDATITAPASVCAGASGTASVAAAANTTYAWTITGATPATANTPSVLFTPTGSGPVTLSVTVSNPGCSGTSAKSVTVNALPDATITPTGPTTFCSGGSVTLTAPAGGTYLWSTGATTQSIAVNASGSYSVTVTNAGGCSATSAPTTVTVNALPAATITPSGPTTFCAGGSVTLTAPAGGTYAWSNGATTASIAVNASGSYSVTVTNASGCSATSAATTVTVNAKPATPAITPSGPTTFCAGGSVTLTAPAGFTYLWSTGATTQSIAVNASGSYSVTVTNASGCSATSAPTAVTVNAAPTATITPSGPTTFCAGGSVTLTASAGSSWLWSNGATTQSIAVSASGSYSVTVTNASGCSATSAATAVTANALPSATITPSGPTTFCSGGSVTLTAPAGNTYAWSTGATTRSISVNTGGSYSVTVTNANGCSATSAPVAVVVNTAVKPTISGDHQFICPGGSATLTASAGTSYLWSNGATTQSITVSPATSTGYTVSVTGANGCAATSDMYTVFTDGMYKPEIVVYGSNPMCEGQSVILGSPQSTGYTYLWSNGATTANITITEGGTYSVTITNSTGCTNTSDPVVITKYPRPTATVSGTTAFCTGGSATISAALTGNGPWNVTWSDGFVQNGVAASPATRVVSPSATTTYFVSTVYDAHCQGNSSGSATVTVNTATSITAQPQSKTIPKNTSTTLSVTATGSALAYQWYRGTSPSTATPVSGATSATYTTPALSKGTYTYWVRVTGACGTVNSNTATITAN